MPKRNGHVPSYRLHHKPSGLARVIVKGEHVYLGQYGSAESREKYVRLIAEMSANRDSPSAAPTSGSGQPAISINEILVEMYNDWENQASVLSLRPVAEDLFPITTYLPSASDSGS